MPLKLDFSVPGSPWVPFGEVKPTDPAGSMSNNLADGRRKLIIFSCALDDSHSRIERSPENLDLEKDTDRVIWATHTELIAVLKDGERHQMEIRTDRGVSSQLRMTHTKAVERVRVLSPQEVLLAGFNYFKKDTLLFSELLMLAVASVWMKAEHPPSSLMDSMQASLKQILARMVAEGILTVSNGRDGQKAYTLKRK